MLSTRFIVVFLLGTLALAWILPASWLKNGRLPTITSAPRSPWSTAVSIEDVSWGNGSPYVRISVGETDMTLPLTGWSLENARGERVEIGLGVEEFSLGKIPLPTTIQVASNTALFASFGPSPIGVSFREHVCSSYLRGTVPIVPPIEPRCPEPSTYPSWNSLDGTCRLLISSLPRCEVISPEHLGEMTPGCDAFLRTVPTYATCMSTLGSEALLPRWRVFFEGRPGFIREEGGSVTLRDERGLVVDTFTYETIGL